MKRLVVRRIEDEVVRALKLQAAACGRTMEAEHRHILRKALLASSDSPSFKEHLASMPDLGTDDDFAGPRDFE